MRKIVSILIVALVASTTAVHARQLTVGEALSRLGADTSAPARKAKSQSASQAELAYTATTADGLNTLYVLNTTAGYVILSADDVAAPLLGYSDGGCFDAANIPANMAWWLSEYSAQIEAAARAGARPMHAKVRKDSRATIAPMITTKWDQDNPCNSLCPTVAGYRCVTGCGPTAMAQIMKYWEYPEKGIGSLTYKGSYAGYSYTASFDFANTTFDWDNMLDDYSSGYNTAQAKAVGQLMYACGVACQAEHGIYETSASVTDMADGFINYLDYDKSMRLLNREWFNNEDWEQLIYEQLAAARPVLYTGQGSAGGHAFVCDGYSSDSYFHINWGWGGVSDGYFLLTALNPETLGTGGGNGGFNIAQMAMVDLQPQKGSDYAPVIFNYGVPLTTAKDEYPRNASTDIDIRYNNGCLRNFTPATITVVPGFRYEYADGTGGYIAALQGPTKMKYEAYFTSLAILASDMPVGKYTLYPAFCTDLEKADWQLPYHPCTTLPQIDVEVTATTVRFIQNDGILAYAETSEPVLNFPIYSKGALSVYVNITGHGSYYDYVVPVILLEDMSDYAAYGSGQVVSLNDGETQTFSWNGQMEFWTGTSIPPGNYWLIFEGEQGTLFFEPYKVTVLATPEGTPALSCDWVDVTTATAGDGTKDNPWIVDPSNLTAQFRITNAVGYWADNVGALVFNGTTGSMVSYYGEAFMALGPEQSGVVTVPGSVVGLTDGALYIISPYTPWWGKPGAANQTVIIPTSPKHYFKAVSSGIESVGADRSVLNIVMDASRKISVGGLNGQGRVSVYSLQGALLLNGIVSPDDATLDASILTPGCYIVHVATTTGSAVAKVMVR